MNIIGPTLVSPQAVVAWLRKKNAHQRMIDVVPIYFAMSPRYGVVTEVAIAQACHETNYGKYTGVVPASFNNFCGLKTTKGGSNTDPNAHARFSDAETGIRAHLQHIARYAGLQTLPDGDTLVDPRWSLVTKFTDTVEGLGGAWAPALTYGLGIAALTDDLRRFANDGAWPPMAAQIPGFAWHPADRDHYQPGRSEKIRGGAQHYTAGTNSLAWLSTTPGTQVSATFLVKHNPTMEDRGWQLVKIEDTAWTTAFANPYTVSIEYEHDGKQPIPDIAYEVLAQTWADITRYVRDHNLGDIETVAGHKTWVNNPSLICPDGIDIGRIVTRWNALMKGDPQPQPDGDWPKVPVTERDPWRDSNPYGKSRWIPRVFVEEIRRHDWMLTGYVISEAFGHDDQVVQYFERARLELNRDGTVTRGLVGAEAYLANHLERVL